MTTIYHVEHGDTKYDTEGKAQGLLNDGLVEKGKRDARQAGRALKGKGIDCVYCSPLTRTKQTAQIIADMLGAKVIPRAGLTPLDIGRLQGKKNSVVGKYLEFFSKRPTLPFPEGESFGEMYARLRKEWIHQFQDDDPVIAVVSHSRDHQLLKHWQRNGLDAGPEGVNFDEPSSGQVSKVTKSGNSIAVRKIA
jgi:broad specificity phosphatase PhoE